MAYTMKKFDAEEVQLTDLDESGETTAKVRHAKGGDKLKIEQVKLRSVLTYEIDKSTVTEKVPVAQYTMDARKVWVLLVDTNILREDNSKWFTVGCEWDSFLKLWEDTEIEVQEALIQAVESVNPQLGN